MDLNKILLVGIFLMAILTVGAVCASDNNVTSADLSLAKTGDCIISDDDDFEDGDDYDPEDDEGDGDEIWDEFSIDWHVKKDVYYLANDTLIASLQLPEDAAGELEVWKDGMFFAYFPLTKGHVNVTLGDLKFKNQGTHSLIFTYAEGDYYVNQYIGTLKLVDYEFKAPESSVLGQKFVCSIDFHKNISGILVVGDEIIDEFDLTEIFYRNFTIAGGICNITLSDLRLARHYFTFDCEEHDIHLADEFWVYPPVKVKNQIIIGQDSFFTLDLAKNAAGEVMFTLYNREDDEEDEFDIYYEDGEFEINSAGLTPGRYDITAFTMIDEKWGKFSFEESPGYDDEASMISFKAAYPSNALIVASNVKSTYTDGKTYKAKVLIASKAIEDAKVVFKINGKVVKRTKTDEEGFASFKISKKPGTYKLTITSLGKTVTKTITVNHLVKLTKVNVKKSAKKLTLKASLSKVNGKYIKGQNVTFKFGTKTYKALTSSKGVAKVTIPKTVLSKLKAGKKITYRATYKKDTVKMTVKVLT